MRNKIPTFDHIGTYRTISGLTYFTWFFEKEPDGVRAYILQAPSYTRKTAESDYKGWTLAKLANPLTKCPFPFISYQPMPQDFAGAFIKATEWAESVENYVHRSGEFNV